MNSGPACSRTSPSCGHNAKLRETDAKIQELTERWHQAGVLDHGSWANAPLSFLNQLWNMLHLARVVTLGALARDESRGAHYKPDFPKRDDANWQKTHRGQLRARRPSVPLRPRGRVAVRAGRAEVRLADPDRDGRQDDRTSHQAQDTPTSRSRWEEFSLPWQPNMNVISCLMEIRKNPSPSRARPPRPSTGRRRASRRCAARAPCS
jgi:hypothetical protein